MKGSCWRVIIVFCCWPFLPVQAQDGADNRYQFRIYEDNDAMNLFDVGSDKGYTNGTRLDFYWQPRKRPFLTGLFPKAGSQSINTHGWSLMHVMITPDNILRRRPDPTDYPYAGGLFVSRSLHSAHPEKRFSFHSELLLGVMGPPAMAEGLQKLIHQVIAAQAPRGWEYQRPTDLLLNYQFTLSKQLNAPTGKAELIGHAQAQAGTMQNSAAVFTTLRLGRKNPYFNGLIQQFSTGTQAANRWQFYFTVQPGLEWMITNALLDGGVFNKEAVKPASRPNESEPVPPALERRRILGHLALGVVLSHGNFGVSFTQRNSTSVYKGLAGQGFGNVSVYISW